MTLTQRLRKFDQHLCRQRIEIVVDQDLVVVGAEAQAARPAIGQSWDMSGPFYLNAGPGSDVKSWLERTPDSSRRVGSRTAWQPASPRLPCLGPCTRTAGRCCRKPARLDQDTLPTLAARTLKHFFARCPQSAATGCGMLALC
jgi:hypothetical protein